METIVFDNRIFPKEWIEFGILREANLQTMREEFAQLFAKDSAFGALEDLDDEHYSVVAFRHFIKNSESFSDEMLLSICRLQDVSGFSLKNNRIIELVHSDIPTDTQLNMLLSSSEFDDPLIKKETKYAITIRKITNGCSADELFLIAQLTDNAALQRKIVEWGKLTVTQLLWISEQGLTKKIRNVAKDMWKRNAKKSISNVILTHGRLLRKETSTFSINELSFDHNKY